MSDIVLGMLGAGYDQGHEAGRQDILARVRALPSPWKYKFLSDACECDWCCVTVPATEFSATNVPFDQRVVPHPDNGCLFYDAHAPGAPR